MVSVRTAVADERSALAALQFRASIAWDEYRALIFANPDAIDVPLDPIVQHRVFVAERNGTIVGFGVVLCRSDGDADLDGLFVEPNMWREGIGARLLRAAEERAADDGAKSLHVVANPRAKAFYLACGFTFLGEEQTQCGIARTMKKELSGHARINRYSE